MSETIEERWPKRWHCVEARDNEFAEQSGPGKPIMAVRNGVNIGTVDLCPKCYETFGHHAARPDQPPFAPGQTVRDTRTGKQHKVARCEKSVVYGTLRWIVDDHNGSRAFADDCVLVHAGTLTTEAVAALVAETEHCFKPLEPSPVRYACTKIAKAGHTVKILAPSDGRLCRVLAVNDPRLLLRPLNGDGDLELLAEFVEFVPEVTIAHPVCRGCNQPLKAENAWMSDGCPCNNPRGINHGLVPKEVCTCDECSPQKESSGVEPMQPPEPGRFTQNGSGMVPTFPSGDWVRSADFDRIVSEKDATIAELRADLEWLHHVKFPSQTTGDGTQAGTLSVFARAWNGCLQTIRELNPGMEFKEACLDESRKFHLDLGLADRMQARAEQAEAEVAKLELRLANVDKVAVHACDVRDDSIADLELRLATSTESMYAHMKAASEASAQLAELRAANERLREAMNDIDAYVRDIRHGATFADSMRDTIRITIRQALAATDAVVAK